MTKTIAITTLGCKINQFESAAMTEALQQDGYRIVPFSQTADVYVINSCTVTVKTDAESRRLIRRAARQNPGARVVVTGCYAQLAGEELLARILQRGGAQDRADMVGAEGRGLAHHVAVSSWRVTPS